MSSATPLPVDPPERTVHPLITLSGWEEDQPFHEPLSAFDDALAAVNRNTGRLLIAAGIWDERTYAWLLCEPRTDAELLTE